MTLASQGQGHALPRLLRLITSPVGRPATEATAAPVPIRPETEAARANPRVLLWLFFGGQVIVAGILFALEVPRLSGSPLLFVVLLSLDLAAKRMVLVLYGDSSISVD